MVNLPSFNETKAATGVPDVPAEGWHNATLKAMGYDVSRSGNDMLQPEFVIDTGDDAGAHLWENYVMGHETGIGEGLLKAFAENARSPEHREGFMWSVDFPDYESFGKQFETTPPLRVKVLVKHELSAETERGWKNRITQAQADRFEEQGCKVRRKAVIKDYGVVDAKAEIQVGSGEAEQAPKQEQGFQPPQPPSAAPSQQRAPSAPSGDGAQGDNFEKDDGLPF
jgi:hypothetical protein